MKQIQTWHQKLNTIHITEVANKKVAAEHSSKPRWYNNGVKNIRVTNEEEFCKNNPEYKLGKIRL